MNTNDLPPAARVAMLIEAGRAANPTVAHGRKQIWDPETRSACALGFACLGAGIDITVGGYRYTADAVHELHLPFHLSNEIWSMNDRLNVTLEDLCHSLREGRLAKITA